MQYRQVEPNSSHRPPQQSLAEPQPHSYLGPQPQISSALGLPQTKFVNGYRIKQSQSSAQSVPHLAYTCPQFNYPSSSQTNTNSVNEKSVGFRAVRKNQRLPSRSGRSMLNEMVGRFCNSVILDARHGVKLSQTDPVKTVDTRFQEKNHIDRSIPTNIEGSSQSTNLNFPINNKITTSLNKQATINHPAHLQSPSQQVVNPFTVLLRQLQQGRNASKNKNIDNNDRSDAEIDIQKILRQNIKDYAAEKVGEYKMAQQKQQRAVDILNTAPKNYIKTLNHIDTMSSHQIEQQSRENLNEFNEQFPQYCNFEKMVSVNIIKTHSINVNEKSPGLRIAVGGTGHGDGTAKGLMVKVKGGGVGYGRVADGDNYGYNPSYINNRSASSNVNNINSLNSNNNAKLELISKPKRINTGVQTIFEFIEGSGLVNDNINVMNSFIISGNLGYSQRIGIDNNSFVQFQSEQQSNPAYYNSGTVTLTRNRSTNTQITLPSFMQSQPLLDSLTYSQSQYQVHIQPSSTEFRQDRKEENFEMPNLYKKLDFGELSADGADKYTDSNKGMNKDLHMVVEKKDKIIEEQPQMTNIQGYLSAHDQIIKDNKNKEEESQPNNQINNNRSQKQGAMPLTNLPFPTIGINFSQSDSPSPKTQSPENNEDNNLNQNIMYSHSQIQNNNHTHNNNLYSSSNHYNSDYGNQYDIKIISNNAYNQRQGEDHDSLDRQLDMELGTDVYRTSYTIIEKPNKNKKDNDRTHTTAIQDTTSVTNDTTKQPTQASALNTKTNLPQVLRNSYNLDNSIYIQNSIAITPPKTLNPASPHQYGPPTVPTLNPANNQRLNIGSSNTASNLGNTVYVNNVFNNMDTTSLIKHNNRFLRNCMGNKDGSITGQQIKFRQQQSINIPYPQSHITPNRPPHARLPLKSSHSHSQSHTHTNQSNQRSMSNGRLIEQDRNGDIGSVMSASYEASEVMGRSSNLVYGVGSGDSMGLASLELREHSDDGRAQFNQQNLQSQNQNSQQISKTHLIKKITFNQPNLSIHSNSPQFGHKASTSNRSSLNNKDTDKYTNAKILNSNNNQSHFNNDKKEQYPNKENNSNSNREKYFDDCCRSEISLLRSGEGNGQSSRNYTQYDGDCYQSMQVNVNKSNQLSNKQFNNNIGNNPPNKISSIKRYHSKIKKQQHNSQRLKSCSPKKLPEPHPPRSPKTSFKQPKVYHQQEQITLCISTLNNIIASFSELKQIIHFQFQQYRKFVKKWSKELDQNLEHCIGEKNGLLYRVRKENEGFKKRIQELEGQLRARNCEAGMQGLGNMKATVSLQKAYTQEYQPHSQPNKRFYSQLFIDNSSINHKFPLKRHKLFQQRQKSLSKDRQKQYGKMHKKQVDQIIPVTLVEKSNSNESCKKLENQLRIEQGTVVDNCQDQKRDIYQNKSQQQFRSKYTQTFKQYKLWQQIDNIQRLILQQIKKIQQKSKLSQKQAITSPELMNIKSKTSNTYTQPYSEKNTINTIPQLIYNRE